MTQRRAVIVDAVRSPFGKGRKGGTLASLHPVDLYAHVLSALVNRTGLDPGRIDDVITGCVLQVGEQSGNIGRQAALAAGFPASVPAVTLDRKCGSAQQAMHFAAQGILAGAYDVVIAGGVEMMSRVPMRSNRLGRDAEGLGFKSRFPDGVSHQGLAAERIAARWNISREELDEYALRSHRLAAAAEDAGFTSRAIAPVKISTDRVDHYADRDESLRRDASLERLSALSPAYLSSEDAARFPEVTWSVTAGNSSPVSDGASAILIVEETVARSLGLVPLAAVTAFSVAGDDPDWVLTAILPATRKLLARTGLSLDDFDAFEINEAYSSVVLMWCREFGVSLDRVNPWGGAIALGHPVGASGGRLTTNLVRAISDKRCSRALQLMCESGGMANAAVIEAVRA